MSKTVRTRGRKRGECVSEIQSGPVGVDCQGDDAHARKFSVSNGLGKLSLSTPVLDFVQDECRKNRIQLLPISLSAIGRVERLPRHHGDPFDRLLAAECVVREEPIISADKIFGKYSVKRIWR